MGSSLRIWTWAVRVLRQLDVEITTADKRIAALYDEADPKGIVRSAPGLGPVLSAAILANAGDFNRFANLAGVRSFTGLVPKVDQSGLVNGRKGITKAGDAVLRQALYMAADHATPLWRSATTDSSWLKVNTTIQRCVQSRLSSSPGLPPVITMAANSAE